MSVLCHLGDSSAVHPMPLGSALAWSLAARACKCNARRRGSRCGVVPPRDALLPPGPLPKRAPPRVPAAAAKPGVVISFVVVWPEHTALPS
jgi:hypothetical protein